MPPPFNLNNLYFDYEDLKKETDIRDDAKKYDIPCVFNLQEHPQQINFLFHHLATQKPRPSV